jgi:hypothetical protein
VKNINTHLQSDPKPFLDGKYKKPQKWIQQAQNYKNPNVPKEVVLG